MFGGSAEDVAVLSWAERRHLVDVAVELLQNLVALRVQDVNLPLGRTTAHTPDPYLVRETERRRRLHFPRHKSLKYYAASKLFNQLIDQTGIALFVNLAEVLFC